jgi:hypothetical protein
VIGLAKIYTILAVAFPILHVYGIGFSTVSLADLLLLLLYPFLIAKNRWDKVSSTFLFYVLFICIVGFFMHSQDGIFKVLRYSCYILALALFSKTFFLFEYGSRVFLRLVLFATLFLLFQHLCFNIVGYYVPGYLPGLPKMRKELVEFSNNI